MKSDESKDKTDRSEKCKGKGKGKKVRSQTYHITGSGKASKYLREVENTHRYKTNKKTSSDNQKRLLNQLKDHIVQIESLIVYLIICTVVLFIMSNLKATKVTGYLVWLTPLLFLIFLRSILRVTNPSSSIRNRLTWAAVFGGVGGGIVGAIADLGAGGFTAGQGALIGFGTGASLGGALGDKIERIGKDKQLLEQEGAFDYLYVYRKKVPKLSNPGQILSVLKNEIPSYDKNGDGRMWYSPDDLEKYVQKNKV